MQSTGGWIVNQSLRTWPQVLGGCSGGRDAVVVVASGISTVGEMAAVCVALP